MDVADAIEAWGSAHREQLDPSGIERLGVVWTTVKRSDAGARDFATLDRDGAARIMGLFAEPDRKDVADLLNTIRAWTRAQDSSPSANVSPTLSSASSAPAAPGSDGAGVPDAPPSPPADVPITAASASDAFVGEMSRPDVGSTGAGAGEYGYDYDDPDAEESAPGFEAEPPMSESLLAVLSALVLMIVLGVAGYYLFVRSDDAPVDTAVETTTASVELDAAAQGDAPQADYCTTVGEFQQQNPFTGLSIAEGSVFYQSIYNTWARVSATAPPEIRGDIAVLQNELSAMNDVAAQHAYNVNDPAFAAALRARGFGAVDGASSNIVGFTTAQCGFAIPTGVEGIQAALPAPVEAAPQGVDPEVIAEDG